MNETQSKVAAAAANLQTNFGKLPEKDKSFAQSLLTSYQKYKGLTPKQEYWLFKMEEKVNGAAPAPAPEVKEAQVGAFTGVYALFLKAKENLKYPKITLQLPDGSPLQLSLAGAKSKVPNVINITDGEKFGFNKWYGRVFPDGKWEQGNVVDARASEKMTAILTELGTAPAETASKYAKLTGRCCFCNKGLTDENSTAVGFGPVCAKNFGLDKQWKKAEGLFAAATKVAVAPPGVVEPAIPVVAAPVNAPATREFLF